MTLLTTTPPVTEAEMWSKSGYGGPGSVVSKEPEPSVGAPVMITATDVSPVWIVLGDADAGVAGGGAFSWMTRTPHELWPFAYSWKVQKVWSSLGSMTVWE